MIKSKLLLLTGILASIALPAYAQFSVDFTTAEGYSSTTDPLGNNADWSVFDGTGSSGNRLDPNAFTVNGTNGTMTLDPNAESGFRSATYVGTGGLFSETTMSFESNISFSYTNGSSSIRTGAANIPTFQIQDSVNTSHGVTFAIRHLQPAGGAPTNGNLFNIAITNNFDGTNDNAFSSQIDGSALGLSIDGAGDWIDGQSIDLLAIGSTVFDGVDTWTSTFELRNASNNDLLLTIAQSTFDADNSFLNNDQRVRVYPLNMDTEEVSVTLDNISVSAIPEPSTLAFLSVFLLTLVARRHGR